MKNTTTVAFLLLIASNNLFADTLQPTIDKIESAWAKIYYLQNGEEQAKSYPKLLKHVKKTSALHPKAAEFKIWQAIIISSNAAYESAFTALDSIENAKALLETSIKENPYALDGAAFVILGTLYYMTPGWPIAFGDNEKADQLLKTGLSLNSSSIDANYFYADYLVSKNQEKEAMKYFKIATEIPSRPEQLFADNQLKKEALFAMKESEKRKLNSGKNKFFSLFSSAQSSPSLVR